MLSVSPTLLAVTEADLTHVGVGETLGVAAAIADQGVDVRTMDTSAAAVAVMIFTSGGEVR